MTVLAVLIPGAATAGFLAGWYANEHLTRNLTGRAQICETSDMDPRETDS